MGGDSFSSKDGSVKVFEQREDGGDMHKQYSMDMVVSDSTADQSQDTGLQKFMGVDEDKGDFRFIGLEINDVEGVSDTRDDGFGVDEGEEVSSEVSSWSSDETVAILNLVDNDIQMGLNITELKRQPSNVTTSEHVVEGTEMDGVLSRNKAKGRSRRNPPTSQGLSNGYLMCPNAGDVVRGFGAECSP
ncbi:hypothetical protein V6N12_036634 [Hibiscus sabdariffa]|uniref:Uncharacterized protein n=1 Tax=Hibiscus sabdariffa TaxID=183260 RepID=A0ABR2EV86_9ROSI